MDMVSHLGSFHNQVRHQIWRIINKAMDQDLVLQALDPGNRLDEACRTLAVQALLQHQHIHHNVSTIFLIATHLPAALTIRKVDLFLLHKHLLLPSRKFEDLSTMAEDRRADKGHRTHNDFHKTVSIREGHILPSSGQISIAIKPIRQCGPTLGKTELAVHLLRNKACEVLLVRHHMARLRVRL